MPHIIYSVQMSDSNICIHRSDSCSVWSHFSVRKWCLKVRLALSQQTNLGKEAHFHKNESKINAKGGRELGWRKKAGFCKFIKRVIFSWQPCTTIHHLTSKAPYPFKAVDSELDIDRTIEINYLLGLRFIDKSFGQMISNNHKWIRVCQ